MSVPKFGFASTLTHGAGVVAPAKSVTTYSRPSGVKPPRPLKKTRSRSGNSTDVSISGRVRIRNCGGSGSGRVRRDEIQNLIVQRLAINGIVLVQNHEVNGEAFQAPVSVRLHDLPHEVNAVNVRRIQKQNRQVAGNAETPEIALAALVARKHARNRAARGLIVKQRAREPAVKLRLDFGRVEMA